MPLVIFAGPSMEAGTKRELSRAIAQTISGITGLPAENLVTLIHENPPGSAGPAAALLAKPTEPEADC